VAVARSSFAFPADWPDLPEEEEEEEEDEEEQECEETDEESESEEDTHRASHKRKRGTSKSNGKRSRVQATSDEPDEALDKESIIAHYVKENPARVAELLRSVMPAPERGLADRSQFTAQSATGSKYTININLN
jgi:hypothetical protein